MIRLLFVDDHPVVSSGLASRYECIAGFQVVGTAATLRDALQLAREADVAVVDIQLDTVLTPRQVSTLCAYCKVVLFSARSTEAGVCRLLEAGASAAVDKSASLLELDAVLRAAHEGTLTTRRESRETKRTHEVLTERERAVYRALASCETPKEVAASLGIARSTVYCHMENIRRKLGVQTLQDIVARAYLDADRA